MDVEHLSGLINHVRGGLYPAVQPLIDIISQLPKTQEVKSLKRKLHRSYTSLSDAIDMMPYVKRSLASYQPDVSFDAEEAQPNPEHLAAIKAVLAAQQQKEVERGQMGAENDFAHRLRQLKKNSQAKDRRAAAARGEALLHIDGGRRTRRRRKQRRTTKHHR